MHFQVSRNGQTYGPYTLEDLRRYVASGNVLPTDLAKSEDMPDWLPVSQILGQPVGQTPGQLENQPLGSPAAFPAGTGVFSSEPGQAPLQTAYPPTGYPPQYAAPTAGALAASRFPDPPNLHWGLVIVLSLVTNNLFLIIWEFVQAAWLKKVQPDATAMKKYITAYALLIGGLIVLMISGGVFAATSQAGNTPVAGILIALLGVAACFGGVVMAIVARFSFRASMEEHFNGPEPIGLRLSGAMTFFFGAFYFQYHLNRINELKQAARMGAPAAY